MPGSDPGLAELVDRAERLAAAGGRRVLGLTGPPAAGKSTLAGQLVAALGLRAALFGMDGFHLANAELDRLGRRERKGAPDTFDAAGYVALLDRLRSPVPGEVVYAPEFRREIEEPVGSAVPVPASVPLVVTEGNYLLVDDEPWWQVRGLLDEVWYLDLDERVRRDRLVARHVAFGRSAADARARAAGSDQRNADLIAATRPRADLVVHLS